jgi:hypothetical protein
MSENASFLVERYQLGTILREYKAQSFAQLVVNLWFAIVSFAILVGLCTAGCLITGFVTLAIASWNWARLSEDSPGFLLTGLIIGGSLALGLSLLMAPLAILLALIVKLIVRSWRAYICIDGLLVKKRQVAAFHWSQIEALWQKPQENEIVRYGLRVFRPGSDHCDIIIRGHDGREVLLERHLWRHFADLHILLDYQIRTHLLPRTLMALNAGESLTFGQIQVDQNGVRLLEQSGQVSDPVPWERIEDMKIQRRDSPSYCVVIEQHDQTRVSWSLPAVANASVLLAIKDLMVGQHKGERPG